MPLIIAEPWLAETILHNLARFNSGDMRIALFKNNYTPLITSVFADFTPADFGGYGGPQTLQYWTATPGGYTSPRWKVTHPAVSWNTDGITSNTVYGYYVYAVTSNILWFAERRATGGIVVGTTAGIPYVVIPNYTRRSEYP